MEGAKVSYLTPTLDGMVLKHPPDTERLEGAVGTPVENTQIGPLALLNCLIRQVWFHELPRALFIRAPDLI